MEQSKQYTYIDVVMEYPLYESKRGRYFIGQTPTINNVEQAIIYLSNPIHSRKNIYLNAMTITSIAQEECSAEFYLRSTFNNGLISNQVTCVNTSIEDEPLHFGQIVYSANPIIGITDGVNIFTRIVAPNSTLVVDGGQIILGPGQSIFIELGGLLPTTIEQLRVAFGWYEVDTDHHPHC